MARHTRPRFRRGDSISIVLPPAARAAEPSWREYGLVYVPHEFRDFFPDYRRGFNVLTDIGIIETHMSSGNGEGQYFCSMGEWYRRHPQVGPGDVLDFTMIEPHRSYSLHI